MCLVRKYLSFFLEYICAEHDIIYRKTFTLRLVFGITKLRNF